MADLHTDTLSLSSDDFVLIGVASGGDAESQIATFRSHYGLDDVEIWVDDRKHYRDFVEAGQPSFPIEIVLDREGIIRYLETAYYPGGATAAAEQAL